MSALSSLRTAGQVTCRPLAVVAALFGLLAGFAAQAADLVGYDPLSKDIYGVAPTTFTYDLVVTAPPTMPAPPAPLAITLRPEATYFPTGDATTALGYLTLSRATLLFSTPGESQTVTVTLTFPATALAPGMLEGLYAYHIHTTGWPNDILDAGSSISSTVRMPQPQQGEPPSTTITVPGDSVVLTYPVGQMPAQTGFVIQASTTAASPLIDSITAQVIGPDASVTPLDIALSGIGSAKVTGTGTLPLSGRGSYVVKAKAHNTLGYGSDTNVFSVQLKAGPPTVAFTSPTSSYTYRVGGAPAKVPVVVVAHSELDGVKTLGATLDGADLPLVTSGIEMPNATGSVELSYTTAGTHALSARVTDNNGENTADCRFTVTVVGPEPLVKIGAPRAETILLPPGVATASVAYSFTTTVKNDFGVDTISASVGTRTLAPVTQGLGLATATSTGTMANLPPGTYTLTAVGGSAGQSATDAVTFVVKSSLNPPSVAINSPAAGFRQGVVPGTLATIPLTFVGTSNNATTTIASLGATLDGAVIPVSSTTLGQRVANGTASMTVGIGQHTVAVSATDLGGETTATTDFQVYAYTPHALRGIVFFDINGDQAQNGADFGISGIKVRLLSGTQELQSTTTDAAGRYSFTGLYPGAYAVAAVATKGFVATTSTQRPVAMGEADAPVAAIGFSLDFTAIRSMKADGFTIGFWKNNIEKAIAGKVGGTQLTAACIAGYTRALADFSLDPFDGLTQAVAVEVLQSSSSHPVDLLSKQLLAAEYNYQNGAYLDGNAILTYAFVSWGEAVARNASAFSSAYVLWAKDWFDAYNNSHGGAVAGPRP